MRMDQLPTPCYVIDEKKLKENLEILGDVREKAGCKILLAQKAFSCFYEYPLIGQYLDGTTASGLYEARLGKEEMGKENHVFAPAYKDADIKELGEICDHIIFNSFAQLRRHKDAVSGKSLGLRINPECSTQGEHAIYDPCAPGSRLGVTKEVFDCEIAAEPELFEALDGLHFHTLCEQNADDLAKTLEAVEEKFGPWLSKIKWLNMGGGHHITRKDYDIQRLKRIIRHFQEAYDVTVYLEPGEAVVLNAGFLVSEVLEIVHNGIDIAILDTSAACHMPDVLEMPYRPPVQNSGMAGEKSYTYRLAGPTCLAGDIIGDYSFAEPLKAGSRIVFEDMALYTMVKTNTFNGMRLPDIAVCHENGEIQLIKSFGYEDFKCRLS